MITAKNLSEFLKENLNGKKVIIALQKEPYSHIRTVKGIEVKKSAGGVHVLIDSVMKQIGGTIVAMASGNADYEVIDKDGKVKISNDGKSYDLKRIFLKKEEYDGFYYGFANQTLWPLFHVVFVKPHFDAKWWQNYIEVNRKFADAIFSEIGQDDAFIWINDYHLALLPKMLHELKPTLSIGTFWHIPWPTHEIFRICPWRKQLIEGLLGSDFISFHRDYHVDNFVNCARRELGLIVESEPTTIKRYGHETKLVNLPAGIDFDDIRKTLKKYKNITKSRIKKDFGFEYEYLILGVERIEYTKGLVERLNILVNFLEKYPEYHGKLVYLSISPPSRQKIPAYKQYMREVLDLADGINWRFGNGSWQPVRIVMDTFLRERLFTYYRLADVCMVTALDDGMNLVAKEYVLSCKKDKGMLVLSKFTGAAKDLRRAVLINPYDIEESTHGLFEALKMDREEKLKRNNEMIQILEENNIYQWALQFIQNTLRSNEDQQP